MKQELKDIAVGAVNQAPAIGTWKYTGEAVIIVLSIILLCIQILYYTRKWMREETKWGKGIKAWLARRGWGDGD